MSFDGFPHRDGAWIKPGATHPDAAASASPLSTALAGAYGYCRTAARQVGQVMYLHNYQSLFTLSPPGLAPSSSVEGIARIEGYVPVWANQLWADIAYVAPYEYDGEALARVSTSADTGDIWTRKIEGITFEDASLQFGQTLAFVVRRMTCAVDLVSTTLGDDVIVDVEAAVDIEVDSDEILGLYPVSVSVYWSA